SSAGSSNSCHQRSGKSPPRATGASAAASNGAVRAASIAGGVYGSPTEHAASVAALNSATARRGAQDAAATGKSKESEERSEARIVQWQSNKRWAYGNFDPFGRSRA
ncbi:hypothetical protein, partial [Burkholderia stabilis]